jgi:lactoylglutathione lyase
MPVTHTRLLVVHFPECFRFYRDILQLQPHWGDEADSYASFTRFGENEVVLAIFKRQEMSKVLGTDALPLNALCQDRFMLIFEVESVDVEIKRIGQQGVSIAMEPTNFPEWGYRGAHLRDPDGNLVELSSGLAVELWSDELREANEKWKVD